MKYKLLVVDVDGTLVGRGGTISPEDREAVKRLVRSGVKVALSTGRVASACLWIIDQLSLDGEHIFFDGALVSSPTKGKEVYAQPLKQGLVRP
ncbi:MAG: HAD family hydrolase, partial [Chloroflexota bacterium]